MRRAKILATIGPASRDAQTFDAMLAAGADGVRINMSHGTYEEKAADIQMARAAARSWGGRWQFWSIFPGQKFARAR